MSPAISVYSSAHEMLKALRSRTISAQSLLEWHLEQLRRVNPGINAVVRTDLDRARTRALELDALADTGQWAGPLHGLPMTVKDTFDTATMPASAGVVDYAGRSTNISDAELVARLRQAGAIVWGKTNTPPLAVGHHTSNMLYGATCNPYDQTRTSGGSSGGASAALAAGITPLELGSDIGGSLRIPAHFCGVYALKTSYGLLPLLGHVPPVPDCLSVRDMNVAGPMARSIQDLRLVMRVLTGDESFAGPETDSGSAPALTHGARSEGLGEYKLAVWREETGFPLSRDCQAALDRAEAAGKALGATILRRRPDIDSEQMFDTFMRLLLAALSADIRREWRFVMALFRPLAKAFAVFPGMGWARWILYSTIRHADWLEADAVRWQMKSQTARFFRNCDAILTPVAPIPAFIPKASGYYLGRNFALDEGRAPHVLFSCWSALASICHLPALTIPAGRNAMGLPVGVQLIGPEGSEARLLDMGEALSQALGGFEPPGHMLPSYGADGGT